MSTWCRPEDLGQLRGGVRVWGCQSRVASERRTKMLGLKIFGKLMICFTHLGHHLFIHDDVIKWKHLPRYWPFVRGIHRSPVNYPHKGQWHGALMFSLICAWINSWVNIREAGDLRRQRDHYDVNVMWCRTGDKAITSNHNYPLWIGSSGTHFN